MWVFGVAILVVIILLMMILPRPPDPPTRWPDIGGLF